MVTEDVAAAVVFRIIAALEADELAVGIVVFGAGREGDAAEDDVAPSAGSGQAQVFSSGGSPGVVG